MFSLAMKFIPSIRSCELVLRIAGYKSTSTFQGLEPLIEEFKWAEEDVSLNSQLQSALHGGGYSDPTTALCPVC